MKKLKESVVRVPPGSVAVPHVQGAGSVNPTILAATNANDKTTADVLKTLVDKKRVVSLPGSEPEQKDQDGQNTQGSNTPKANPGYNPQQPGNQAGLKEQALREALALIINNRPDENKVFQDGWGMSGDLYQELVDLYYSHDMIPDEIIDDEESLSSYVQDCYASDSQYCGQECCGVDTPCDSYAYPGMSENVAGSSASVAQPFFHEADEQFDEDMLVTDDDPNNTGAETFDTGDEFEDDVFETIKKQHRLNTYEMRLVSGKKRFVAESDSVAVMIAESRGAKSLAKITKRAKAKK
jgi:hypothetical protein